MIIKYSSNAQAVIFPWTLTFGKQKEKVFFREANNQLWYFRMPTAQTCILERWNNFDSTLQRFGRWPRSRRSAIYSRGMYQFQKNQSKLLAKKILWWFKLLNRTYLPWCLCFPVWNRPTYATYHRLLYPKSHRNSTKTLSPNLSSLLLC